MNRHILILISIYIAVILLFAYIRPEKLDWSPSFSPDRTIPFASQVLFQELGSIRTESVQVAERPIYNVIGEMSEDAAAVYFFLNREFSPGTLDIEALLEFVSTGNTAFISSEQISSELLDTLGVRTEFEYLGVAKSIDWFYEDNIALTLTQSDAEDYPASVSSGYQWYILEDTTHTILGNVNEQHPNYIRCAFGEGQFFLHAFPYAFTNYHMLYQNNHRYVSEACSAIPPADLWIWDTYYITATGGRAQTPLAALNRYASFRWAYWIGIIGICIFIVFTARRRQRVIPVVEPKRNMTLDFIRTIGDLYFHRADQVDLIGKKIAILQSQILKKYRVQVVEFSPDDAREIAARGAIDPSQVETLFAQIRSMLSSQDSSTASLFTLQQRLDRFLRRS